MLNTIIPWDIAFWGIKHKENRMNTNQLMELLEASPNRFMEVQGEADLSFLFHEYLAIQMENHGYDTAMLIKKVCISKAYMYQVMNGQRTPGRDIILRMALVMGMSVEETQRILTIARKGALYPKIQRDAAVLFCLRTQKGLDNANILLENLGEKILL